MPVDIGEQADCHDNPVFFEENVLVVQVTKDTLANRLPDIVVLAGGSSITVSNLPSLVFGRQLHGNLLFFEGVFAHFHEILKDFAEVAADGTLHNLGG